MPKAFEDFQNIKYNDIEEYEWINRDYRVNEAIKKNVSIKNKKEAMKLYYDFKDNGYWVSDHFIEQYISRLYIKNSQYYTFDEIVEQLKERPNYRDIKNNYLIIFNKNIKNIAIIKTQEEEIDKYITIGYYKKVRKNWEIYNE